jgi:hypothetical protein
MPEIISKFCPTCRQTKGVSGFNRRTKSPDGLQYECRDCKAEYWNRPKTKIRRSALHLQRSYGLTIEQREKIIQDQEYKCPICGAAEVKHTDHDHKCCPIGGKSCGKCVRGILCHACNIKLGVLEQTEWVAKARIYLAKYKN